MGGDFAPRNIVAGTVDAIRRLDHVTKVLLVGREDEVRAELGRFKRVDYSRLEIVPATEVVAMDEAPAVAIRRKKDSSIGRAVDLVRQGEADAVFSAGNTGAAVAAATLKLRTLKGVTRPAIATVMPTHRRPFVLIDAGANTDCDGRMLAQFAVMGSVYSEFVLKHERPTVGLLSIGGEEIKGNETTKEAFGLLRCSGVNFIGNIEGHDLFEGKADVVVCDGFVGNVVLKTCESVSHAIAGWLKTEFMRNPVRLLGYLLMRNGIKAIRKRGDPAASGGAPLLGTNGICIIGHGTSSPFAVYNAIRVACESVETDINHVIIERLSKMGGGAGPGEAP